MKKITVVLMLAALALLPGALMAMDHGSDSHGGHDMKKESGHDMDHGKMDHSDMDHGKMEMHGGMDMLGSEVQEGVKATLMIKDTSEMMAKMGMEHTHHLMVNFANEKNGAAVEKGTVAIKVVNPDQTETQPVKMMGMSGAFGADLALKQKGMYQFYIGTQLEDGTKRQFHFHTEVK